MTAYSDSLVMGAMENFGEMADSAVDLFGHPLDVFWEAFAASAVAREVEVGSPFAIMGKTGVELAVEVCEQSGLAIPDDLRCLCQKPLLFLSRAYWCGWILAFYQWHSGRSFSEISRRLPISTVQNMYGTYHEQSEERFAEAADEILSSPTPGR